MEVTPSQAGEFVRFVDAVTGEQIERVHVGLLDSDGETVIGHRSGQLLRTDLSDASEVFVYSRGYRVGKFPASKLTGGSDFELRRDESLPVTVELAAQDEAVGRDVSLNAAIVMAGDQWRIGSAQVLTPSAIAAKLDLTWADLSAGFPVPDGTELHLFIQGVGMLFTPEYIELTSGDSLTVRSLPLRNVDVVRTTGEFTHRYILQPDARTPLAFGDAAFAPMHRFLPHYERGSIGLGDGRQIAGVAPCALHMTMRDDDGLAYARLPMGLDDVRVDVSSLKPLEIVAWSDDVGSDGAVLLPGELDLSAALATHRYLLSRQSVAARHRPIPEFTGPMGWRTDEPVFTALDPTGRIGFGRVDEAGEATITWQTGRVEWRGGKGTFRGTVSIESRWAPCHELEVRTDCRSMTLPCAPGSSVTFDGLPEGWYLVTSNGAVQGEGGEGRTRMATRDWVHITADRIETVLEH